MEQYLQVGVISSAHGVHGEVNVYPTTDDANRFKMLKEVLVEIKGERNAFPVNGVKFFKNMVILKLGGIDDRSTAERYKGCPLLIERKDAVDLKPGEYFLCDLVGLEVYEDTGAYLGRLEEIIRTGANDVYVVKTKNEKEVLIPNIKDCIIEVSLEKSTMTVHLLEGLL